MATGAQIGNNTDTPRTSTTATTRAGGSTPRPGRRAAGAHGAMFAAIWCEGRVLGDDTGDLFDPLPEHLLHEAADVAHQARQRVDRALARDRRTTPLDQLCPWCGAPWSPPRRPATRSPRP